MEWQFITDLLSSSKLKIRITSQLL